MISIIIPTFNEEKAISGAITQFSSISSDNFEIIVTDGGSTDSTVALATTLTSQLSNVKIVEHPKDKKQTISSNRNNGAQYAKGSILMFIDADARIKNPAQFLQIVEDHFAQNSKLSGLLPQFKIYPEVKTILGRLIFAEINLNFFVMNNILGTGAAIAKCQIVRVEDFKKINGYREDLPATEDMDLFARLAKIGKTKVDLGLVAYLSARRQMKWGWITWLWIINRDFVSYKLRNKIVSKEWTPVR